jgi:putative transcriptional regulator
MIGTVLVAPPAQEDEFWASSVVFIYEQNATSVVGLVVNKPTDRTLAELADHHGIEYYGDEILYAGGPVNPAALVMLHTDDWHCGNTMQIGDGYRVSSDKNMLKRLCSGDRPRKWRLFLGMSGWTPTQLQGEMLGSPPWNKKTAWLTASADENIIFGQNPDTIWKKGIDSAAANMVQNYFSIF